MRLLTGLNPYGLTYHLGLHAPGPRANPRPAGLRGFIALATEFGAKSIELWEGALTAMSEAELIALRYELRGLGMVPVLSSGLEHGNIPRLLEIAEVLGSPLIRVALTGVLCGDRAVSNPPWAERVASTREKLARFAPMAAASGKILGIENHQDFTSRELVAFCDEFGPSIRIVYDTGNSFPVAEAPLDFTRVIAPYVRHIHLKDYNVQQTEEGFRLVRSALGDGAVPFRAIIDMIAEHHDEITVCMELAALQARHVRLKTEAWWQLYPPRDAAAVARCLEATMINALPPDADYRTPWEKGEDDKLEAWELAQIRRSAANMKALGIL